MTIVSLAIIVGILSCVRPKIESVDISGYLYGCCGTNVPEANATIAFSIYGADLVTTTTDARGYFRLKGDYKKEVKLAKMAEPKVYIRSNQSGFGDLDIVNSVPNNCYLDTVYVMNGTFVHLNVTDINAHSTINDTIYFLSVPICENNPEIKVRDNFFYNDKIAGPFSSSGFVEKFDMQLNFRHVGYVNKLPNRANALYVGAAYFKNNEVTPRNVVNDTVFYQYGQKNSPCKTMNNYVLEIE